MHVPRGQQVPNLNKIVWPHFPVTVMSSLSHSVADSRSFDNQPRLRRDLATVERHDRVA
jgi:hypothetical protein